jgi:imidazolonepropionase-like amidohydrolase
MTIRVEGERITAVYPDGGRATDGPAEVRNLEGRVVVPGLIDSHIHLGMFGDRSRSARDNELRRMLYGGIVAAREMGGDVRISGEAARRALLGQGESPDILYSATMAGPGFVQTAPRAEMAAQGLPRGSAAWMQAIDANTDVRLAVARAAGTGANGLKLYAQLPAVVVARIVEEAHRQGLEVWAHATIFPDRPMDYVAAGVDMPSHACGLVWQDSDLDPGQFRDFDERTRPSFDPTLVDPAGAEFTAMFQEFARLGTPIEPTLAVHSRPGDDRIGCRTDVVVGITRSAIEQGVTIVAGTDFVAEPADPYPSLFQELDALVSAAGLSPLQAITAATGSSARALGIESDYGTVTAGRLANFVVLGSNPSEDIAAIRDILFVVKRGVEFPRGEFGRQGSPQ